MVPTIVVSSSSVDTTVFFLKRGLSDSLFKAALWGSSISSTFFIFFIWEKDLTGFFVPAFGLLSFLAARNEIKLPEIPEAVFIRSGINEAFPFSLISIRIKSANIKNRFSDTLLLLKESIIRKNKTIQKMHAMPEI